MLTLRFSPASPYARKVRIAAELVGLTDRITLLPTQTGDPKSGLTDVNPLGKIPTLTLENGETLFDSRVIVDYLDHLGGGRLVPPGEERFRVLRHQALADGILDAALLLVYEGRYRPPEHHVRSWTDMQAGKISRALDHCEAALSRPAETVHIGHVAQACVLGYLDLRFAGEWRRSYPALVAWLEDFAARVPVYDATRPPAGA
ncbi:glutathione S-transferase family protein [Enterovirga aerilata]|uniref:Glutathione S-transferase family protein n=1 Tax=Enterovirga aerilata TaxID=2730920 RepID=A0A849IAR0_9HYPH|nr:glutathione S-transferase family protein [Enterovirga sp. DB1703]NNM73499.1 glutathione S-transferase family protein [Enterovirga sp. DB1703]